jgi:hypothetical protein
MDPTKWQGERERSVLRVLPPSPPERWRSPAALPLVRRASLTLDALCWSSQLHTHRVSLTAALDSRLAVAGSPVLSHASLARSHVDARAALLPRHLFRLNCTGQTKESGCVTTAVKANGDVSGSASQCTALLPNAQIVTRLENRPNNAGSRDHTPSGEPFHGLCVSPSTS